MSEKRAYNPPVWTAEETERAVKLYDELHNMRLVAKNFPGKSECSVIGAIARWRHKHGTTGIQKKTINNNVKRKEYPKWRVHEPDETTKRPCLCCRKIFDSKGIYNRLCPRCVELDGGH